MRASIETAVRRLSPVTMTARARAVMPRPVHLVVAGAALALAMASASPAAGAGSVSGSFGDRGDAFLSFTITGGDLSLRQGTPASYEGTWTGGSITLSGEMTVTRSPGTVSYVSMSANVAGKSWSWPPTGQDGKVSGRTVSEHFSLTFDVPRDFTGSVVGGSANLRVCGGVCGGYAVDFQITMTKPAGIPTVRAFPVKKVLRPGTHASLPFSVRDRSGKAIVHAALYEGGTPALAVRSSGPITADGHTRHWKARLAADLRGPLFFCVWAENAAGKTSVKAPRSSCAWLSLLVDIDRVSNTCGGEGWDSIVAVENAFGNTSTYRDPTTKRTYKVNFADACDLHDAGYGGYTVRDRVNRSAAARRAHRPGPVVDFHSWSRNRVDHRFLRDMQTLCRRKIPAKAASARHACVTGNVRYWIVRKIGWAFFDADLLTPGTQSTGARDNT